MRSTITYWYFAPAALLMLTPVLSPVFGQTPLRQAFTDPSEIDRAVMRFTGAPAGTIGGARTTADRRLRLAHCPAPLMTSWHGQPGQTVRVECPEADGWRIFVVIRAAPQAAKAAKPVNVVKRGDPVTVAVRGRGFAVQQSGEAMDSGAVGDWIAVRMVRRGEPIRARIVRPGFAVIPVQ